MVHRTINWYLEAIEKEEKHFPIIIGINFVILERYTITFWGTIESVNDDCKVTIGGSILTNETRLWNKDVVEGKLR